MKLQRGGPFPLLLSTGSFGERLERLREWQNLSRAALAKKAGVSQRHLKGLEAGTAQLHSNVVRKLAEALGVTVAELVG